MLTRKTISFLLKIGIVALALFFLYNQLILKSNTDQVSIETIFSKIKNHYFIFFILILMMLVNWFIESIKWKFLIAKVEKISILLSIRAVFSGITISAFTPNRVGEYGGRVFCLKEADRLQAAIITFIGSMAQLVVTLFFGCIGLMYLPKYYTSLSQILNSVDFSSFLFVFVLVLLKILIIFLFFNISILSKVLSKIRYFRNYEKYSAVFSFYTVKELAIVLFFSIARYAIFTTQFFILLRFFDVNIAYSDAIFIIMVTLFIVSIIPTIAITEIGVRGSVSIFLFGLISNNAIGIFSATFVIWIINLLLPALIGTIFIFTLKFFRT